MNFWRLIYGNQFDIAALEWCKIFGSDGEPAHWKKIVPIHDHAQFRADLLAALNVDQTEWSAYWQEMKTYRDSLVAHHIEVPRIATYPKLDLAVESSYFYYDYLIKELRSLGETRYPNDLREYCRRFEDQAREVAKIAMKATAGIKEQVF